MKQAAEVLKLEKETAEKLAAKAFAKSYLTDLVPSVFNNLRENGYFYDPVNRDLETGLMPWLISQTVNELDQILIGRLLLDTLLKEVLNKRENEFIELEKKKLYKNHLLFKMVEAIETIEQYQVQEAVLNFARSEKTLKLGNLLKSSMWTVLAFFVAELPKLDLVKGETPKSEFKVVALGTGTKSLGRLKMDVQGMVLNDCHGEVLARRSLIKTLFKEIAWLKSG